jgi:hypothetical protein
VVGERAYIDVQDFQFDQTNTLHLARHGISKEKVQAVVARVPRYFKNLPGRTGSHVMVGPDSEGRFIYVVLGSGTHPGQWYPITGWRLTRRRGQQLYSKGNQNG